MRSLVLTCLVGVLAAPVATRAQEVPPPAAPTTYQEVPVAQGQQPPRPPQGRGGRGTAPTPTPPAGEGQTPRPAARSSDTVMQNVRVEISLTDTLTGDSAAKKTVTMLLMDGNAGSIRSQGPGNVTLNLDAQPHVRPDGRVALMLSLQYLPDTGGSGTNRLPANVIESMTVLVTDGQPTLISQSADPRSDRKVTVEATATIVK